MGCPACTTPADADFHFHFDRPHHAMPAFLPSASPAPNGSATANSRPPCAPRTAAQAQGWEDDPDLAASGWDPTGNEGEGVGGQEERARTGRETHLWWHSRGVPGYSPSRIRGSGRDGSRAPPSSAVLVAVSTVAHPLRSRLFPLLIPSRPRPRPRPSLPSPLPASPSPRLGTHPSSLIPVLRLLPYLRVLPPARSPSSLFPTIRSHPAPAPLFTSFHLPVLSSLPFDPTPPPRLSRPSTHRPSLPSSLPSIFHPCPTFSTNTPADTSFVASKTRVIFQPTFDTTQTIYWGGHWLRVRRGRGSDGGGGWRRRLRGLRTGGGRGIAYGMPAVRGAATIVARSNTILKALVLQAKREYEAEAVHRIQVGAFASLRRLGEHLPSTDLRTPALLTYLHLPLPLPFLPSHSSFLHLPLPSLPALPAPSLLSLPLFTYDARLRIPHPRFLHPPLASTASTCPLPLLPSFLPLRPSLPPLPSFLSLPPLPLSSPIPLPRLSLLALPLSLSPAHPHLPTLD
ncbi:hypothetical protein B0H14DRAFT_3882542 [Mycena olivaceomarginata]|nr:hypothetical protein B0H14DRAFT_3882542 [Mycena olivaceomarginata]